MAAAEAFVGGAKCSGDLAYDVDVLDTDQDSAGTGAERAGGRLVIVGERHRHAGGGEGGDRQEAPAVDIGAA